MFGLCCGYGKYKVHDQPEFPPVLQRLLTATDAQSREFKKNIREYNSVLSLASRGFTVQPYNFPNKGKGPPVFKISGQVYHIMGPVFPNKGTGPQFSQMYVYDEQHELENRMKNVQGLRKDTLQELQEMMHEKNELAKVYKTADDV